MAASGRVGGGRLGQLRLRYARERDRRNLDLESRPAAFYALEGGKFHVPEVMGHTRFFELLSSDLSAGHELGICEVNSAVVSMHWDLDLKLPERWGLDDAVDLVRDTCLAALRRCFPQRGGRDPLQGKALLVLTPTSVDASGARSLLSKEIDRVLCGKCANPLTTNHSAFRYECAACGLGFDAESLQNTHARPSRTAPWEEVPEESDGEGEAGGDAQRPAAREERLHKIGIHVVCRNAEWTDDGGAPGAAREPWVPPACAGPFVDLQRAQEINDVTIATAQHRRGADLDWADVFDPSIYGERSSLRLAGCIKKVRCDTCRSATPALRKACMLCRGSGQVTDDRRYALVCALNCTDGERAELPVDAANIRDVLHATSVRTPPGTAPSEGYARVEGIPSVRSGGGAPRARGGGGAQQPPAKWRDKKAVDAVTRERIETFIRETWPTKYHSLTVTRAFVTGARSAIVNVTGEGSTYCHHKHGEHTSNNIFFQILHAPPSSARIFQRCFSHRVIGNVRCRDWNARGADAKKIELPPEVAATLFGTYSMPTAAIATGGGVAEEERDDDDTQKKGGRAKADGGKQRKRGSSRQHRAKVKALGGILASVYCELCDGDQTGGQRVCALGSKELWVRPKGKPLPAAAAEIQKRLTPRRRRTNNAGEGAEKRGRWQQEPPPKRRRGERLPE